MALGKQQKIGLAVGGLFIVLVVGLLVFLHTSGKVEVEHRARWTSPPDILICEGAPAWVKAEAQGVVAELETRGLVFGAVAEGTCPLPCSYKPEKGPVRQLACREGVIVIDLRDRWFSEEHAGETLWSSVGGFIEHATVLLPEKITDDTPAGEALGEPLPRDSKRLVLAHELVHALGYEHSVTQIAGGAVTHKTGELMNPELRRAGWGMLGLP